MQQIEFSLTSEYIELMKLLKLTGVASSGGEAKNLIVSGAVSVNGEPTQVKRLKIRQGDSVTSNEFRISISK